MTTTDTPPQPAPALARPAMPMRARVRDGAHVILLGNEKGGSGKSTAAMHVIVHLLRSGVAVGSLDLDARQGTLTRYIENRERTAARKGIALPMPRHQAIPRSTLRGGPGDIDERTRFTEALGAMKVSCGVVVIDTPGSDTHLSRLAHAYADTIITPLNDSFIDLDLLARVDPETLQIQKLSFYSALVWEQKKNRALRDGGSIDWVVMRNRLSATDAKNKRRMADVLERLAKRLAFRLAPGLGDRVIYRELFLAGLTLLDLREPGIDIPLTMSHIAARQEIRAVLEAVDLPAMPAGGAAEPPAAETPPAPDAADD